MTKLILAVDPGKLSGVALFSYTAGQEPELVWSDEVDQKQYAPKLREAFQLASYAQITLDVACERFVINAQTVRNSQSPYSIEQIGILKQVLMDHGREPDDFSFQAPSDAKNLFGNDKLKKLGYWHRGGEGHALDAMRHGLLRLVKIGWKPLKLLENS